MRRRLGCINIIVLAATVAANLQSTSALVYPSSHYTHRPIVRHTSSFNHPSIEASIHHQHRHKTSSRSSRRGTVCLTTKEDDSDDSQRRKLLRLPAPILSAIHKFKSRPSAYLLIPVIAAFVGWFTNYLAVQMIFYPIKFK